MTAEDWDYEIAYNVIRYVDGPEAWLVTDRATRAGLDRAPDLERHVAAELRLPVTAVRAGLMVGDALAIAARQVQAQQCWHCAAAEVPNPAHSKCLAFRWAAHVITRYPRPDPEPFQPWPG